jgi:MFS family permease
LTPTFLDTLNITTYDPFCFLVDLLFPFLAFMVEDMGYTGERLGYHAGLLAASFCGAQFCTSVPWGMISDRYGRRIAIILGTLGAGIGMFIFGFSKTYAQGKHPFLTFSVR